MAVTSLMMEMYEQQRAMQQRNEYQQYGSFGGQAKMQRIGAYVDSATAYADLLKTQTKASMPLRMELQQETDKWLE